MKGYVKIGCIFGIQLELHFSWLVIAVSSQCRSPNNFACEYKLGGPV